MNHERKKDIVVMCLTVLALVAGCKAGPGTIKASDLEAGQRILVRFDVSETGGENLMLEATGIDIEEGEIDDDVECEQQGEHEGENEGCEGGGGGQDEEEFEEETEDVDDGEEDLIEMMAGPGDLPASHDAPFRFLGLVLTLPPDTIERGAGNYRFIGRSGADGAFVVDALSTTDSARYRVLATISSIEVRPDGLLVLHLLGLDVVVDPDLRVREVGSFRTLMDDDIDGDDVQCEQEGEHEGENEGC